MVSSPFHRTLSRKERTPAWRASRTVWVLTDPTDARALRVHGKARAASLWQVRRRVAQVLFPIRQFVWVPIASLRWRKPKGA